MLLKIINKIALQLRNMLIIIIVKKEFLDEPVFVAGTHRGLDVDVNKPCTTMSLTSYISFERRTDGLL